MRSQNLYLTSKVKDQLHETVRDRSYYSYVYVFSMALLCYFKPAKGLPDQSFLRGYHCVDMNKEVESPYKAYSSAGQSKIGKYASQHLDIFQTN